MLLEYALPIGIVIGTSGHNIVAIHLKEGNNEAVPGEPGIYTTINERDLRKGEWNNRRQWNMKVGGRRQTF
jgi:hypothetical protein